MKPAARRIEEREAKAGSHYQLELGAKSLLSLFFALAVVCGMFFAFGYTIGKHAIPATFRLGSTPTASATPGLGVSSAPVAGVQPPNPQELSAAEANQTPTTLSAPTAGDGGASAPQNAGGVPATVVAPTPTAAPGSGAGVAPAAASNAAAPAAAGASGVFHVQVFAGVQADAQSLATALKAKGYPAIVVAPAAGASDDLYRVQVGPYLTSAEAQAMRSRLTADGYQAVVKQ
ncbi:MAG TPA: SPOR domain-containing protein [Terriglobales bacterium]|nr:SPOR domain-containing protein [Terriglobales bacterium]